MSLAIDQAKRAYRLKEVPIGAVVISDGKILGRGFNKRESADDPLAHAEIIAIRKAAVKKKNFRLSDCEIYVTVEPCILCLGAIIQSRIKRIVFGCRNPREGALSLLPAIRKKMKMNYKIKVTGGVCQELSKDLLRSFFQKLRTRKS